MIERWSCDESRCDGPRAVACLGLVLLLMMAGCGATQRSEPPASRPVDEGEVDAAPIDTQASAERLHEIAGSLLLFYVKHNRLPERLAALRQDASLNCPPLHSPTSGRAYVYHNPPLRLEGRPGSLLIHDPTVYEPASEAFAEPVHWALLIDDRPGRTTLGTQVIFVAAREIQAAR